MNGVYLYIEKENKKEKAINILMHSFMWYYHGLSYLMAVYSLSTNDSLVTLNGYNVYPLSQIQMGSLTMFFPVSKKASVKSQVHCIVYQVSFDADFLCFNVFL